MPRPLDPAKRQQVLDAALTCFVAYGYAGTPVPEVAQRAGVATGTLYRYFLDKQDLVNAVYLDAKARLREALLAGLDLGAPPRVLFDAFWGRLSAFAHDEPAAFHFLELQDHLPYLGAEARAREAEVLGLVHQVVLNFQTRGVFRADLPADVAMAVIWGAFVGTVKAVRLGYLPAQPDPLLAARDATWRACSHPDLEPAP
jgi:AcrR family transcriptional regulator